MMRSLQRCAGPHHDSVDVDTRQRHRSGVDSQLSFTAPDRQRHAGLIRHRAFDVAESRERLAIDGEQQIALPQQLLNRRTAHHSRCGQDLAHALTGLLDAPDPVR